MSPPESEEARQAKAAKLAYEKGTSDAKLAGRLDGQDRRLAAINGSIDRTDKGLREVKDCLDDILQREQSRDAVANAIAKSVERHGQAQITTRQFVLGIIALVLSLGALIVAVVPQ